MNEIVDHIYVINMKKDVHRLIKFKTHVDNLFEYEVFEGVDVNNDEKYKEKYKIWKSKYKMNNNNNYESFDWIYYVKKYNDLINIKSKKEAWEHWQNNGRKELRSCFPKNDIVNSAQWGCLYSHINVLKDAMKNKYKSILILEDDIILTNNIQDKIKNLKDFVNTTNKWNIIYLGVSQHHWKNVKIKDGYYLANGTTGSFAYMVNSNFYKIILNDLIKGRKPIDNYLVDLQNLYSNSMYVIYPNIIICNLEESNIGEKRDNKIFFEKFKWEI
jgi:GR25 family glycosyltransferase involved in LPS biosynthesis